MRPSECTPISREAALAALVLVLSAGAVLHADAGHRPPFPVGWALLVLSAGALVLRQRHPVPVLAVTSGCALLYYPLGFPDSPMALSFVLTLYVVARDCWRPVSVCAALVLAIAFPLAPVVVHRLAGSGSGVPQTQTAVAIGAILLLTIAAGEVARSRRERIVAAEWRVAEAEATREQEASQRATAERLRIARELHDVVAHQISLINVQAGAALHTRDPDGALAALEAIRAASKEALREVRTVLGVLRQVDSEGHVRPTPSLSRLPELVAHTEASGLLVRLTGDGAVPALPAPIDLAAYRIVQEALTNAVRHAPASTVRVDLRHTDTDVIIEVENDGPTRADPEVARAGNGLLGMTERAAAVGGELHARPTDSGGFRVRARLPLPTAEDGTGRSSG
ncbi:sensor histidine kinase [Micromonospora sp. KC723]|uniref:sensor histidine kinase n=1 Tax=Micromonospora sp. KC723 TaxID=2530381 RepID=UPI00104A17A2|nr:sensor histidine kinase [Micromonospora sp. KC723]TDB76144.1 sensor histidine kinase [Micromonospora sp. KC723]